MKGELDNAEPFLREGLETRRAMYGDDHREVKAAREELERLDALRQ